MINEVIQGDCLEVLKTLSSDSVDLVVTSPPYNKHSAQRNSYKTDSWKKAAISYEGFEDNLPEDEYQEQQKQLLRELVRVIKPSGSIFYNHKYRIINHQVLSPEVWLGEFVVRQVIIWNRGSSPILEPIRFLPTYEQIYWITKEAKTPYFTGEGFQMKDIWRINPEVGNDHPAPFPETLVGNCIRAACPEGGVLLDPYMGSGTTAVVARKLGRNYIGIELNPEYIKVARERIKRVERQSVLV